MAQLVKLEPGDVLVLSNLGSAAETSEAIKDLQDCMLWLKEQLQLSYIVVFEGDVDLSVLAAGWTPDAVAGS